MTPSSRAATTTDRPASLRARELRVVHLADLHLGFRQYQRLTPGGINQREADVAGTFVRALDRVIELAPRVILIAGDVFHSVRPTNQSILHAFGQFHRLRSALPDAEIIMIAGNHDTPRSTETGGILQLFARVGITVVDRDATRLSYPSLGLSVLAVPFAALQARPKLDPDPEFEHNILLLHGPVEGSQPSFLGYLEPSPVEVTRAEIGADRWSYVALGHYHVYHAIEPNLVYGGSIDYTSTNVWGELREERGTGVSGKGFVERDLVSGRHVFHDLRRSRPFVELPMVDARGRAPAEVDSAIRDAVAACRGDIDEKIVRLVVGDLPRHLSRELDHRAIREYKRRALHFQLDFRRQEAARDPRGALTSGRRRLDVVVREKLDRYTLDPDLDRPRFVELGLEYLAEAATASPAETDAKDD